MIYSVYYVEIIFWKSYAQSENPKKIYIYANIILSKVANSIIHLKMCIN